MARLHSLGLRSPRRHPSRDDGCRVDLRRDVRRQSQPGVPVFLGVPIERLEQPGSGAQPVDVESPVVQAVDEEVGASDGLLKLWSK